MSRMPLAGCAPTRVRQAECIRRPFHGLAQLPPSPPPCRRRRPRNVGHFGEHLPHRGGLHLVEGVEEIAHGTSSLISCVVRNLRRGQVDGRHEPCAGGHRGFARERLHVGPDEAVGDRPRAGRSTSTASGMPRLWISRISRAAVAIRDADLDLPVEAARPAQGRIEIRAGCWSPRSRSPDHGSQPVHQRQQLRDHALLDLALHLGPLGRDGVDLVEEDDARRAAPAPPRRSAAGSPRFPRRTCG